MFRIFMHEIKNKRHMRISCCFWPRSFGGIKWQAKHELKSDFKNDTTTKNVFLYRPKQKVKKK